MYIQILNWVVLIRLFFKRKELKKSQLQEICRILLHVNSNKLHGAILCKFRATAIFNSFLIKMDFSYMK